MNVANSPISYAEGSYSIEKKIIRKIKIKIFHDEKIS